MPYISHAEQERFEDFARDLVGAGRKARTVESYRSDWQGLARWVNQRSGEPLDLARLNLAQIREYRDHLLTKGKRASTINRKLTFVRRYAAWAVAAERAPAEIASPLREVSAVEQPRRRPRALSDLERQRLVRVVEESASARDAAIVHTLLQTGMRVSELVALRREDLKIGTRGGSVYVPGQGQAPGRRVRVGSAPRRALRRYLKERGGADGPLFLGERGPLTANAVQRVVRRHCRTVGVRATPSTLRHTFASRFLRAEEGDLVDLADLLGHECLDTTRLYVEMMREASDPRVPPRPRLVEQPAAQG